MNMADKFFVYLLLCSDNSLYCGWTNDLESRLAAHNSGKGAKYTQSRRPVKLVYFEELESKSAAMTREWFIKHKMTKAGMNPKTLQYLMGHSDIGVTLNVYTHLGLEDAAAEMARMEEVETARREQQKLSGVKEGKEKQSRKMFRVV